METRRSYYGPFSATGPSHGKTPSLHRIRALDDISTMEWFSYQIEMQLRSLKINTAVCNTIMEFSHSDIESTGIVLGVGPANGRQQNDVSNWSTMNFQWKKRLREMAL